MFVVAAPRSGTTILQSYLAAHPRIATFPETSIFSLARPASKWWAKQLRLVNRRFFYGLKSAADALSVPTPARPITLSGSFRAGVRMLDQAAGDVDVWVEKSSHHIRNIDNIQRYVPGSCFVHVVRDGRDSVASMRLVTIRYGDIWHGPNTVEKAVDRWNEDVRITRRCLGEQDHLVIRYEDLMIDPDAELQRICELLGLQFDPAMLIRKSRGFVDDPWKRTATGPIRFEPGASFAKLTRDEQKYIDTNLDRLLMTSYGYA